MRRSRELAGIVAAGVLALLAATRGACALDADVYAGKTLTIIAGFPPGGGIDGEMRLLARHFSRFIPGRPAIIARNMQGAGGIVLGNHLYSVAPADGFTLGMPGRSGFLLSNVVPQKGISYDLTKFSYVGGAGSAANALWLSRRTGITSLAELKNAKKEVVIGALSARSENAIAPRVLAASERWPLKVVTGYAGFHEVLIAIERGEVDGLYTHEGSVANTRPDMIASGEVKPIVQSFAFFPDVPILSEVVADANARALLGVVSTPNHIGLPLLGPPRIPADRLDILRKSYLRLMDDAEYRADADRRGLPVGRAVGGDELQQVIARSLSSVPEAVVKDYLAYTGLKAEE